MQQGSIRLCFGQESNMGFWGVFQNDWIDR